MVTQIITISPKKSKDPYRSLITSIIIIIIIVIYVLSTPSRGITNVRTTVMNATLFAVAGTVFGVTESPGEGGACLIWDAAKSLTLT